MSRKQLTKRKIEAQERIMRKLSYLPIITTTAALLFTGFSECRDKTLFKNEVKTMYCIEYDTCDKPGGLERARIAFERTKKNKEWKKAKTLRDVIAEMKKGRPSRIKQCEIRKNMKKTSR